MSDRWLTVSELSEIHEVSTDAVYSLNHLKKDTDFLKKVGKNLLINETKLIELHEWRRKTLNKCHENYYKLLLDYNISDAEQARSVQEFFGVSTFSRWYTYLNRGMFSSIDDISILATKVSERMKQYFEWSEMKIESFNSELFRGVDSYPHVDLKGFNSVDDYYDYYEAEKIKNSLGIAA